MRTIKFRALYKERKNSKGRIVSIKQLHFGFGSKLIEAECYWKIDFRIFTKWVSGTKLTLLEFTGLKDKKGVEIYEGDIVKTPYYIMGKDSGSTQKKVVEFHNGMFGIFGNNKYSFTELFGLFAGVKKSKKYIPNFGEVYDKHVAVCEVIGNIYEDEHLLT